MATLTPTYAFWKPTLDGDENQWGKLLNANWDKIDVVLQTFVTEAPEDGIAYARQDKNWVVTTAFVDAPVDGVAYARQDNTWVPVEPFPEAPDDGRMYGREGLAETWRLGARLFHQTDEPGPEAFAGDLWLALPDTGDLTTDDEEPWTVDDVGAGTWYPYFSIESSFTPEFFNISLNEGSTSRRWLEVDGDVSLYEVRVFDYDDGQGGELSDQDVWKAADSDPYWFPFWAVDGIDLDVGEVVVTFKVSFRLIGETSGVTRTVTITYNESVI